jgi:hypothetical protein
VRAEALAIARQPAGLLARARAIRDAVICSAAPRCRSHMALWASANSPGNPKRTPAQAGQPARGSSLVGSAIVERSKSTGPKASCTRSWIAPRPIGSHPAWRRVTVGVPPGPNRHLVQGGAGPRRGRRARGSRRRGAHPGSGWRQHHRLTQRSHSRGCIPSSRSQATEDVVARHVHGQLQARRSVPRPRPRHPMRR